MKFTTGSLIYALAATLSIDAVLAKPNFVFILTDDQDAHMNSMDYMPEVQDLLVKKGAYFDKHYCTIAICCPSRANIWTGQLSHNTNVTNVQMPWGGYKKFIDGGYNDAHLALWLQKAGYNTYYSGKLFNGHNIKNYDNPKMSGYTDSAFFLEPYTYQYYNNSYTRNGDKPTLNPDQYSTDIVGNMTQEFIDDAMKDKSKPFFITAAPIAPHGWLTEWRDHPQSGPPKPAHRHKGLYKDYKIPRTDNFNPDEPSSVNWISKLEKLNNTVIDYNDEYQRLRLRALKAVDEMVGDIVRRLDKEGVLDNTYIIYSTDNGFHISQHRLHPGKMCGLETDINIPMVIRGPGIEAGSKRSAPSSHSDLAPTLLQLAGEDITNKKLDGAPIDLGLPEKDYEAPERSEHVAVEFWGKGLAESHFASDQGNKYYAINTYKGLRIVADDYGFYYSVWCNNATELYDMKNDPGQLDNLISDSRSSDKSTFTLNNQNVTSVVNRLDALLMVLKSCKEDTCRYPWRALHPDNDVRSLKDALKTDYDNFYAGQTKVKFDSCRDGFIMQAEGATDFKVLGVNDDNDDGETKSFVFDKWILGTAAMTALVMFLF